MAIRHTAYSYKSKPYKRPRKATMVMKDTSDYRLVRSPKVDYKVSDFTYGAGVTSTGTIQVIHGNLTQGTNYINNYIGRTVDMQGLDIRYAIVGAVSNAIFTADQNNLLRVLIFQWMDDAVPTVPTVLQAIGASGTIASIQIANYENINVLHDRTHSTWCTATTTGYASSNGYSERHYIKKKKLRPIDFNNTTGGTSKGGLFMLAISDSAVAPNPSLSIYCRMTFTDA